MRVPEPMSALHALTEWAMAHGLPLADISVQRPDMLIVAAWGVAGALFAMRRFSWSLSQD
jgi:hypothetical protein